MAGFRQELSLDGEWEFAFNGEALGTITVPLPWEAAFPQLREMAGTGLYECTFTVPKEWSGKRIWLHIGAAEFYTEVSLNGQYVGKHEGGYTPFGFFIESYLVGYGEAWEQTLTLSITDATKEQDATLPNGKPLAFKEIPHGKQSWYTSIGGLWQSVKLVAHAEAHLQQVHLIGDIDTETVSNRVTVQGVVYEEETTWEIVAEITSSDPSKPILIHRYPFLVAPNEAGETHISYPIALPEPRLWHPDTPHLYTATLTLERNGVPLDSLTKRFGMRKIETRDGWVWLNGKPIFLVGVLDQDFYPQTLYTPPSEAFLRDQFLKAKELGLNLMRCHIKVPTETYLDLCDELGLLVWYEIPNGKELTATFRNHAKYTFTQMWGRDACHPSICFASIINESWGIDLNDPDQRDWLRDTYYWAKSLAISWLIVDNSPCIPNFHVVTDLDDYHIYFNIPDHATKYAEFIQKFAERNFETWTPYGDAEKRGREPLILSEFGNWGLPSLEPLVEAEGGAIWWFPTGWDAVIPEGVQERFEEQKLSRTYANYDALAEAAQWQEYLSLKWEIEEMRRYSSIAGYVITEFSDLNWECNGLLDFARNPKVFHKAIQSVLAQDILIPRLSPRTALFSGESATLEITFSNFTGREARGGVLRGKLLGIEAEVPVMLSTPIGATVLAESPIITPEVKAPTKTQMEITLHDAKGVLLASTTQSIVILPQSLQNCGQGRTLWTPDLTPEEQSRLHARGFQTAESTTCGLFTTWTEEAEQWVRKGGIGLLCLRNGEGLPAENGLGIGVESREKSGWWGDWCGGRTWFVSEAFPSLPDTQIFDFEYQSIIPNHVMTGMLAEEVLSGLYIGWLRNPAGLLIRKGLGQGILFVTTFDMLTQFDSDPISGLLIHDLLKEPAL